jgi:hypothetical protein
MLLNCFAFRRQSWIATSLISEKAKIQRDSQFARTYRDLDKGFPEFASRLNGNMSGNSSVV